MDTERLTFFRQVFGGAWMTQALAVAAELGIAEQLGSGPRSVEELAAHTQTHAPSLYRVLRALASVGVFAETEARRFTLTPLAELLRRDAPGSQRAMAIMMGGEFHPAWGELLHSTRTGEPGFRHRFGSPFFEYMQQHPDRRVIEAKVAALEGGGAAVVFGSGMAAITTLLFAHLKPGDHAVFQPDLYGSTFQFVQELTRFGVAVSFARTAEEFAASVRPETKVLYVESPSNPLLRVVDLAAIGKLGHARGILTVADNTFATPINQNPLGLGLNAVIHSGTKYLNGHSDLNAGLVVASAAVVERTREYAVNHGGMLDAHACFLLERGLKTLALRVKQHSENAAHLADFLLQHPAVADVHYPGLPCHPDHALAARQMRGFGGMLSFELRDPEQVDAVRAGFKLVMPALSLCGVESLVCVPARTSHRKLSPEERARAGISDGLVRVSAGVEDSEDLLEDFTRALEVVGCC